MRWLVRLVIVSVLGWCLWSLVLSRTVGEFFVRPNCVIYGRSGFTDLSKCQTVAGAELVSTVSGFAGLSKSPRVAGAELVSTVNGFGVHDSEFVSTVSGFGFQVRGFGFHDGDFGFQVSDFGSPPVSFWFP